MSRAMTAVPGQDLLEGMVDQRVADNRLARSRFLRWLGAGVFGMAVGGLLPREARADVAIAASTCGTTLSPCHGLPLCPAGCTGCCRNDISFCDPHCTNSTIICESGTACWNTCSNHRVHKCCDCRSGSAGLCICHFILGTC